MSTGAIPFYDRALPSQGLIYIRCVTRFCTGGSTAAQNLGKTHQTGYTHFSLVDPDTFDVSVHDTTNPNRTVLNVHVVKTAAETKQALESWFNALQHDPVKMLRVEQKIGRLTRLQPKRILVTEPNGSQVERIGRSRSST